MKYAIVGVGSRHEMFRTAITRTHAKSSELVGLCDDQSGPPRALRQQRAPQSGNGIATYDAADFDQMLAEQQPDTIIVTTPDYLHHDYIVRAL